ncbi:MAG: hypothetical protein AAF211_15915 [Myxococcota bacterium]
MPLISLVVLSCADVPSQGAISLAAQPAPESEALEPVADNEPRYCAAMELPSVEVPKELRRLLCTSRVTKTPDETGP